jgi:hypothetical protein
MCVVRKDFRAVLKELQNALGKLNDITVHEQLSDSDVHGRGNGQKGKPREEAFAMGPGTRSRIGRCPDTVRRYDERRQTSREIACF